VSRPAHPELASYAEHPSAREILTVVCSLPADDADIYLPADVATAADRHALSYGDLRTLQRQLETLERATSWIRERPRSSCAREMRDQVEHQGACNTQEGDLLRWAFAFEALSERLLAADQKLEALERDKARLMDLVISVSNEITKAADDDNVTANRAFEWADQLLSEGT
jgi:hypothetical protein